MADERRRVREVSESSECEESANDTSLNVTECVSCCVLFCVVSVVLMHLTKTNTICDISWWVS